MSKTRTANLEASVHQRLLNLSRERGEDFNLLLTQYALERLLYRLSQSEHANQFVLKGALLFNLWPVEGHRPTRDIDLLGYGDSAGETLMRVFGDICAVEVQPDGLSFNPASLRISVIREDQAYEGQRVELKARLGKAQIPVQIDIGFGDVVTPPPEEIEYPALLGFPAPRLRAYPIETVVAEKLETIVVLGIANSRMKDFYDLWIMARFFPFDGPTLVRAIRSTFERRRTGIPRNPPMGLTKEFSESPEKTKQWQGFLKRTNLTPGDTDLSQVVEQLGPFLMPPLAAAAMGQAFDKIRPPDGSWTAKRSPEGKSNGHY